jgi:outer membrane protein TolC
LPDLEPNQLDPYQTEPLSLNLPTALAMVGGQHPAVALAQWRIREAYARLVQTRVLWLPTLQPGVGFDKHDGNLQNSEGEIRDVNRNSLQYGLGTGATGAGTTMRPGVVAQFRLADAIFEPRIATSQAWAREHAADGAVQEQLLQVALAYLHLLDATQAHQIVQRTRESTAELAKLTRDFAATGQGSQADADRLETELRLVDSRVLEAHEQVDVAAARLAEQLHLAPDQPFLVLDPTVVPIHLVSIGEDRNGLIRTGLLTRPELKEAQALVAAADEQYRRQKMAPFLPSVLLGYSTGVFGGGRGSRVGNLDGRYDFDAIVSWELRNLGWGEAAARREAESRWQQTYFSQVRLLDQVAREISEAHLQVTHRSARMHVTEAAILSAEQSLQRNLTRIRDGQGLPLEALQSIQALEHAQRAYLESITAHNAAQFRLQRALGWPIHAPADTTVPTSPLEPLPLR